MIPNPNNARQNQPRGPKPQANNDNGNSPIRSVSRGAAIRAQKRSQEDAHRIASQYLTAAQSEGQERGPRANFIDDSPRLKLIGLGGLDGGGSKNMLLVEYMNDAVVMDCGNDLGVDLPGINYGIADTTYLASIKHKLRAYIITHGHLDHIGGLPHIVPLLPAPIYGSRFTIGRVEEQRHRLTRADRLPIQHHVFSRRAHDVPARRGPPQHFLDRGVH